MPLLVVAMKTIYTALGWRLNKIKEAAKRAQGAKTEQYDEELQTIRGYLQEMQQLANTNCIDLTSYLERHGIHIRANEHGRHDLILATKVY